MQNMKMDFLDESWLEQDEFIMYGFGEKLAQLLIDDLLRDIKIVKIIDNDAAKHGEYRGIPIVGVEAAAQDLKKHKIVVALSDVWYLEVAKQLADLGLEENVDFCRIKTFFSDYYYGKLHRNVVYQVQSIVTSKCTLNCEKCGFFIPYYQNEYTCDARKQTMDYDLLFQFIDYVPFISLIGGETFLYDELGTIIEYLREHYFERYGSIIITTNGTVIPDQPLLQIMKKARTIVEISDYTSVINYEKKFNELCDLFKKNKIRYSIHTFPAAWSDLGFPNAAPQDIPSVREHMLLCSPECKGYYDGKLYFCDVCWSAEKCGLISLMPDDCIDLRKLPLCEESKRKITRFSTGIFENKDYISMCAVCNGYGVDNQLRVKPGVQKPRT